MHEYSIVQSLIAEVQAVARGTVKRVEVSIGELAGVEPDLLAKAFTTFRERTVCAGAELTIQPVAAHWVCSVCAREIARGAVLRCCNRPAQLAGGDEIVLDRIEMEVTDV